MVVLDSGLNVCELMDAATARILNDIILIPRCIHNSCFEIKYCQNPNAQKTYLKVQLLTQVRASPSQKCETYLPATERQSSINDVDSPLWRQNKFQLQPCEIGFPWSIRGLRITERFHAPAQVPFFQTTARLGRWARSLLLFSVDAGFRAVL